MTVNRTGFGAPLFLLAALLLFLAPNSGAGRLLAQTAAPGAAARQATGGAQTLADILARQKGLKVNDDFRRKAIGHASEAALTRAPLGTLGGASDPELWRALRYGEANVTVSTQLSSARATIQSSGMSWLKFRRGPLIRYGSGLLLGVLVLLALFYVAVGKFRLAHPKTGIPVPRFSAIERFSHWLMAGSFVVLALSGLMQLMGRLFIIPLIGKDAFAPLALAGKWTHNNIAWAFILGLVLTFVLWIAHNLPERGDIVWLLRFGGLFSKGDHAPAKKFNAGQKLIFWSVMLLGGAISLLGLSLLFPFDLPIFAPLFSWLNGLGLPALFGAGPLPVTLAPQQEMQLAQALHAVIAFVLMAIILAHIYIGSIGMEGALDAMVEGTVDEEWAREHHSLWLESLNEAPRGDAGNAGLAEATGTGE